MSNSPSSNPTTVWRAPSSAARSAAAATAGCSTAEVTTCAPPAPPFAARALPRTARLSDSVPPLVKHTLAASAPSAAATVARASSSLALARRPHACPLEGFPKCSSMQPAITSATSARTGVVAA